jgi:hypothetical protein
MGTVWNAGMRDEAAGGLAHLLTRPVWRDSRSGPALRDAVTRLVTDESPLVRMRAARGWRALHCELDPVARTAALGGYIMAESDGRVLAVLLSELPLKQRRHRRRSMLSWPSSPAAQPVPT